MKRFLCLLLSLCLFAPLCGCAGKAAAPAPDDLTPVLESISANVHPGTAGSSLRAAQQACLLMDWCCETEMDESAVRAAAESFLAPLTDEDRQLFAVQLDSVKSAADYLISEDGAGLLEDIGGAEGTLWPWEDAPQEQLSALLAAAGADELP